MNKIPEKRPSFFKVLTSITDFARLLRLPPFFLEKYELILPENIKLRISSGKTWNVKVEQMENGLFCFTHGWENFAKDVGLKFGEFLVFMFDGESLFDVSVYGTSACRREFPASSFQVEETDSDEDHHVEMIKEDDDDQTKNYNARDVINERRPKARNNGGISKFVQSSKESNPLYFEVLLKSHHRSRVTLPKKFWMAAGLVGKETVLLEYVPKHQHKSVALHHRTSLCRIEIAKGWYEFRRASGVRYGKTYSFEFEPSKNVIRVNEVKRGN